MNEFLKNATFLESVIEGEVDFVDTLEVNNTVFRYWCENRVYRIEATLQSEKVDSK